MLYSMRHAPHTYICTVQSTRAARHFYPSIPPLNHAYLIHVDLQIPPDADAVNPTADIINTYVPNKTHARKLIGRSRTLYSSSSALGGTRPRSSS